MKPLLSIESLHIQTKEKLLVDLQNLAVNTGEIVGLVGESGSGKSLAAKALLGLLPNTLTVSGNICFAGNSLNTAKHQTPLAMAAIFQHPAGSFTPVLRIGAQITEVILLHDKCSKTDAKQQALALLADMGLADPTRVFNAYPQQLSGGMLQRAAIAMALACKPALLIADEPTTALDSLTQTEVLDLLQRLQQDNHLSVLLISHDLPLVAQYSDRVAVMRYGQLVEQGAAKQVLTQASHPYTQELLNARPDIFAHYSASSRLQAHEL